MKRLWLLLFALAVLWGAPNVASAQQAVKITTCGTAAPAAGYGPVYVDSTGKTVLSAPYYWVAPFRHGFALIRDNKKGDGYIDKSGKLIVPTSTAAR